MAVKSGNNPTFTMEGFDELIQKLEDMGSKGTRIANAALKKAAEPIAEEAQRRAPVDTGTLKRNIQVLKIKQVGGRKVIEVGIKDAANGEAFHGRFIEYGTSKMAARPFLWPAFKTKEAEAKEIIMTEIKTGLGLK